MARRINLVPKTERVRTATNVPALLLLVVGVLVVFGLGLGYYLLSNTRASMQDELTQLIKKRTDLEQQVAALAEYKVLESDLAAMEKTVTQVYAGRTLVSKVLSDLSRAVPDNVWFLNMTLTAGDPVVAAATEGAPVGSSGIGTFSVQGNTYSFPDVAQLLVRLKLVSSLQRITLNNAGDPIGTVDARRNVRGFSLVAAVVNTQSAKTTLPVSKVEAEGL